MKERTLNRKIGITGLIVVVMMLAMVPTASAGAFTWVGNVTYSTTGEWVPDGWQIQMVNLNHSEFAGQPWTKTTQLYMYFNAYCDGEMENTGDHIYVNVTSPDEKWFGEFTARLGDMDTLFGGKYIQDIIVYEVPVEPETFTKSLPAGWNLISLPLTADDNSTSAVLTSISGNYDAVKSYNAATHQFEDATTMDLGIGYFVHVTTAGTWSYEGTAYESMTAPLSQGLNMVGWTNTSAALPDALSSIANSYRYVAHWNATSQSYEVYEPNAPAVFNDFTTMERGEGYFIAATSSCTLAYP